MKLALLALSERLPQETHLVATIHDEIVVEVPEGLVVEVAETVRETMTEAMQEVFGDKVPFPVDVCTRTTWGS